MSQSTLENPVLIQHAYTMRKSGMFVSDIANMLSRKYNKRITQKSLWELFLHTEPQPIPTISVYKYPSLEDISYLFNSKIRKDKNLTTIKITILDKEIRIRRDIMIQILNTFYNKTFTYNNVRNEINDWRGEEHFLGHWRYLLNEHYIENVEADKYKFCDPVKQWKLFK